MSNSWNTSSQSSPGFVYFNNPTTPQKSETQDYIGFGESSPSPSNNQFSPRNYSSPQQQWGSPRNYGANQQGRFKKNRYSGNQSFSPNKTYNSSFNRSNPDSSYGKSNTSKPEKTFNKHLYLHPSFMEDPWKHLEKMQARQSPPKTDHPDGDSSSDLSETERSQGLAT